MISKITIEAQSTAGKTTLAFDPRTITVFVGPNNAGKSLALEEINACLNIGKFNTTSRKLVKSVVVTIPDSPADIEASLQDRFISGSFTTGYKRYLSSYRAEPIDLNEQSYDTMRVNKEYATAVYGHLFGIFIRGGEGVHLTRNQNAEDLQSPPTNHLAALFKNEKARESLRSITHESFGYYLVVDITGLREFRLRMSKRPPADEAEEQGIDGRAREFHKQALDIATFSNGIRSYTGILTAVRSATFQSILIDEPEAFLHPPLARRLGSHLAELAQETGATIITATHSADFMSGCIESGVAVNIVRLTYRDNVSTARLLPSSELTVMMRDPLLRSVGVISAFFYEGAIITESAADRAFYQEVNTRLLLTKSGGHDSSIYLNAQNKQTACRIAKPLRRFGVPAAIIVDIDVIKEGGANWTNLLSAAGVPDALFSSLSTLRATVLESFNKTGKNMKRDGGIALLNEPEREACESLFEQLATYGVFVTPNGELESWLGELGASGHGPSWLIEIFEKMGSDPATPDYRLPSPGDVWDFIRSMNNWLRNPNRKGMAST